jgi:hypothetical protein
MIGQAAANACELTVKGVLAGVQRGWLRVAGGAFQSDRAADPTVTDAQLRAQATVAGQERTYHCVPPGSGVRIGVDRDEDGFFDRDELDAGSDPADPSSTPGGGSTTTTSTTTTSSSTSTQPPFQSFVMIPTTKLVLKDRSTPPANPTRRKVSFKSSTKGDGFPVHIDPPFQGSPNDPTLVGAIVAVYNSSFIGGELVPVGLPAAGWTAVGPNSYKYKGLSTDAITRAVLKPDQIMFKGGKDHWSYTLNEPSQGRVAAVLLIGGIVWCADAPAKFPEAKNDRVDKFVAQPKTPAPFFCPGP